MSTLETALTRIPKVPSADEDEANDPNPLTHTISEPKGTVNDRKAGVVSEFIHSNEESVADLVASVLRTMRKKEALHRPLRHDQARIKNHQPNEVLAAKFGKLVNDELERHNRNITTKEWLRISTWWLLKVGAY